MTGFTLLDSTTFPLIYLSIPVLIPHSMTAVTSPTSKIFSKWLWISLTRPLFYILGVFYNLVF